MPYALPILATLCLLVLGFVFASPAARRWRDSTLPVASRITDLNAEVAALLSRRQYARESRRARLVAAAAQALSATNSPIWAIYASGEHKTEAKSLRTFLDDSVALVAEANRLFVGEELSKHAEFFDSVESKPLTGPQRTACVVGEDSNLVLAGAGTGKTSTMIGRAGYLMESKRAEPDQVLMLAYARKAANEMQERQDDRLSRWTDSASPKIKTFHALGLEILGEVDRRRPDLSPLAEDKHAFAKFIDEQLAECCDDPVYRKNLIRYCGTERYPYRNPFDFSSMQEYLGYVRENELRTLQGTVVKSFEEVVVANFLSANSVQYEYERPYEVDTAGPDYRQYKPDFYLPEYGVYIEHFALDENGQPPTHFDQVSYLNGVKWKRELHSKHKTKLLETYSYLKRAGLLESHLRSILESAGVVLSPKPDAELLAELRAFSEVSEFAVLLSGFLTLFKESDRTIDDLRAAAAADIDASRLTLLLQLLEPVFDQYETELSESSQIDFADMIRKATRYVEDGSYRSRFTHVLVDEFQDISRARARLISALIRQNSESVLFCVGDDWQSIYRFTGSDIAFTRDFGRHFGPNATTPLDTTFRFNDKIGDASSSFVLKNPAQIRKSIASVSHVDAPAVSMIRAVKSEDGLAMALDAISNRTKYGGKTNASVLVLGRYNFTIDDWSSASSRRRLEARNPNLKIDVMTVHAAKGKEADYVVILGLSRGKFGFPSEKPTDAVLEFLLPEQESFLFAEERRLFYVAMTRARHRVYMVYDPADASPFVIELLDENSGYPISTDEFAASQMAAELPFVPCPVCRTGSLVPKSGPYGDFIGCNSYPYCRHREKPCPQCGSIMRRTGGRSVCSNPTCGVAIPICPRCGARMVERTGPYGRFWGCSNYRKNTDFVCTHTINIERHGHSAGSRGQRYSRRRY